MEKLKKRGSFKVIQSDEEYNRILESMELLWQSSENSPEADLLETLSIAIEEFEKRHYSLT